MLGYAFHQGFHDLMNFKIILDLRAAKATATTNAKTNN
jgi:hypothetical protein